MSRFLEGSDEDKQAFARELGDALHEIGFAILVGHGIDTSLHDRAHEDTERLFTETRLEDKLSFRGQRHGSVNQGYFPIKETSDIHPDLVEGWVFCRRAFDIAGDGSVHAEDFWPIAELEPRFRELCLAQERLIHPIAQALLTSLGCDPHHLDRALTGTNSDCGSTTTRPSQRTPRAIRRRGCLATRTSTSSPCCPRRASRACRC